VSICGVALLSNRIYVLRLGLLTLEVYKDDDYTFCPNLEISVGRDGAKQVVKISALKRLFKPKKKMKHDDSSFGGLQVFLTYVCI